MHPIHIPWPRWMVVIASCCDTSPSEGESLMASGGGGGGGAGNTFDY